MFLPSAPAEAAIAALLCCALLCFALPSLSSGQSCWCFVGPPYSSTMYFPPQHASSRSMRPRATAALPPPYRRFRRAQNLHGDIVRPRSRACLSCGDSLSLSLIVPLGIRGDHTSRPAAEIDHRRYGRFRPQACLQCSSPILATPEPMAYAGLATARVVVWMPGNFSFEYLLGWPSRMLCSPPLSSDSLLFPSFGRHMRASST